MYRRDLLANLQAGEMALVAGWVENVVEAEALIVLRDPSRSLPIRFDVLPKITAGAFASIEARFHLDPAGEWRTSDAACREIVASPREGMGRLLTRGGGTLPERLKLRYLALRSARLQANLRLVDEIKRAAQRVFRRSHFMNIETPYLTRSVYEYTGNDFVVSAPLWNGKVAHLAQSPQVYKQLLMIGGFERYYQFARNFRAEPGGPTHLQEFTQIDAEMVSESRRPIQDIMESIVAEAFQAGRRQAGDFATAEYSEDLAEHSGFRWVVDGPLAHRDSSGRIHPSHHVMTLPANVDELFAARNAEDLLSIQGTGYDLEFSGMEVGGGDLRITNPSLQRHALRLYGFSEPAIDDQFGYLLKAMEAGVPQHGGFALGLTRLAIAINGEENLEGVQAFPMTYQAEALMNGVPFIPSAMDLGTLTGKQDDD